MNYQVILRFKTLVWNYSILANEKDNHKFNFLLQNDPYHTYYEEQVEHYRKEERGEGVQKAEDEEDKISPKEENEESEKRESKADVQQQQESDKQKQERERRSVQQRTLRRDATGEAKAIEPPDEAVYSVDIPEGMSTLDLDVIKLTAQFVARNGKQFLTELTSREHANPQFAFLKPTHSLFSLFTSLADAYSKVLMPPRSAIERVKRDSENKEQLLERCLNRLEWEQAQERKKLEEEAEAQKEREALARIDWQDFVVAEKIEFGEDDDEQLPEPLPKRDVIAQIEGEGTDAAEAAATASVAPSMAGEEPQPEEPELDEEERELVEQAKQSRHADAPERNAEDEQPAVGPPAPPAEEGEGDVKIVKNYQPPGKDRKPPQSQQQAGTQKVVSPITGEVIDADKMAEHMRVSLIDPKWKQEREAMLAKIRDVSYASDDEIANNIVGLAKTRPDIFGSSDEEMSSAVSNEINRNTSSSNPSGQAQEPLNPAPQPQHASLAQQQQVAQIQAANRPQHTPQPPPSAPGGMPSIVVVVIHTFHVHESFSSPTNVRLRIFFSAGCDAYFISKTGAPPPPPAGARLYYSPSTTTSSMINTNKQCSEWWFCFVNHTAGAPPPPGPPPAPTGSEQYGTAVGKRYREDDPNGVSSETAFLQQNPGVQTVQVSMPQTAAWTESSGHNAYIVQVDSAAETVASLKERLAVLSGWDVHTQKLYSSTHGYLKDGCSLASYNIGSGAQLQLV